MNELLGSLHREKMERNKKRTVYDLTVDDDNGSKKQKKCNQQQIDADAALALRLQEEEDRQGNLSVLNLGGAQDDMGTALVRQIQGALRHQGDLGNSSGVSHFGGGVQVMMLNAGSMGPTVSGDNSNMLFEILGSLIFYQLGFRGDGAVAVMKLKDHFGGALLPAQLEKCTPESIFNIVKAGNKKIDAGLRDKTNAIVDLAQKWPSLPQIPGPRVGPQDDIDRQFVKAVEPSAEKGGVAGVGKWTLYAFLEQLGRTDVLNAGCHEVKVGVQLVEALEKTATKTQVEKFGDKYRQESWSSVAGLLRDLHRDVQAVTGLRKPKNPSYLKSFPRALQLIAQTRNDLARFRK